MTEEHKQHMREAALRRFAAMDEGKRTAFKEKCAANGRKSWAMRSAADKAAQIARINTPEVRKRASDANKAKYQAMTDEERAPLVANPCGSGDTHSRLATRRGGFIRRKASRPNAAQGRNGRSGWRLAPS